MHLFIVTCYGSTPHYSMMDYINNKLYEDYIVFVLPAIKLSNNKLIIKYMKIKNGIYCCETYNKTFSGPVIFMYIYQYILHFFYVLKNIRKEKYTIGYAEGNYNAAILYLLKCTGVVEKTLFMNGDLIADHKVKAGYIVGDNYLDKVSNYVVVTVTKILRRIGVKNTVTWYPTASPMEWDREHGIIPKNNIILYGPQRYDLAIKNFRRKKDHSHYSYLGQLTEAAGIYLVIDSVEILKKKHQLNIYVHIIGGDQKSQNKLIEYARNKGVLDNVVMHGFLADPVEVQDILSSTVAGFAMYQTEVGNISVLDIDNGKIKEYISSCIIPICTRNALSAQDALQKGQAGIFIDNDSFILADILYNITTSFKSYIHFYENIVTFAGNHNHVEAYDKFFNCLK